MNRKMLLFIAILNFYIIRSGIPYLINDYRDYAYKFLLSLSLCPLFSIIAVISLDFSTYRLSPREDLLTTQSETPTETEKSSVRQEEIAVIRARTR